MSIHCVQEYTMMRAWLEGPYLNVVGAAHGWYAMDASEGISGNATYATN